MLFLFLIASAYKAYAVPVTLGPDVFPYTPFTFLFGRSPCDCGPQERTLFEVIRGCILTIFACVYTSLHPNVPNPKATKWEKFLGRLKMAFYMLIVPEAVIWWATRQWYGARAIARQVTMAKPDLKWTTTHGHFVQMGGLQGVFPDGRREVITPSALIQAKGFVGEATYHLLEGIDPDELRIPKDQIEDRSKGDFLSKGLVILQTSWFVLECIARFQRHLPLTALEVVTLAFAVLNAITYGLWWDKPLNVNCQVHVHIKHNITVRPNEQQQAGGSSDWRGVTQDGEGVELTDIRFDAKDRWAERELPLIQQRRKRDTGIRRGLVVRSFLALVLPIRDMFTCDDVEDGASQVPTFYADYVDLKDLLQIRLIVCLIGMIFGGLHFIAWHAQFPTHTELVLWRASSLVIVIVPFLVGLFGMVMGESYYQLTWRPDFIGLNLYVRYIAMVLYVLGPILYILARLALIIQAFISLRALPAAVFETVAWTSYIPHL